ncbi:MAG: hypothetical protein ACI87W_000642 [Halieaceae bacterium]|jgi:hypothetical protein
MSMDRRSFLKYAAGSTALAGTSLTVGQEDDRFPLGSLEAHVKMRGNLRGERTYWYYKGTVFGNRWGESTLPMLGVEGVSYSLIDTLEGGRYRYNLNEAGYYLDPHSGALSEQVKNPFTGEYYQPKHYVSPQATIFSPDLSVKLDVRKLPPDMEYRGEISPVRVFQNAVVSSEDLFVRLPVPSATEDPDRLDFKIQTSLATLTADRRDLLNPSLDFVPCQLNYQTLATFREWMGMGRQMGMMSWRMVGTKCGFKDLPHHMVERISADHEGFFG